MEFITIALALVDLILFGVIVAVIILRVKEYAEYKRDETLDDAAYDNWRILNGVEDSEKAYSEWLDTICDVPDEVYEAFFEALDETV